jgi:DNA polymerase bacteriophage-type
LESRLVAHPHIEDTPVTVLFLDFETRSTVNLKKAGADVYARHPSTSILCIGYAIGSERAQYNDAPWELDPEFEEAVRAGTPVVIHNAPFELAIWNEVGVKRYGWPRLLPEQTICTMAMCYAMALPGNLENAAPAAGLTAQKDTVGHRVMLQLSKPRSGPAPDCFECGGVGVVDGKDCFCVEWYTLESHPEKFEQLYKYCVQDVEVERQLFKRLVRLSQAETRLWELDYKINQRGVQVDVESAKKALALVAIEKDRLNAEIREVSGGVISSCAAIGQLVDWLKWQGFEVDGVTKADVSHLLLQPSLPPAVRRVLELRQQAAKTSTAKLDAMLNGVCADNRLRGMFQYHGAGATGRWAGRRVQLQNLPRSSLKQEQIDEVFEILEAVQV